jgi:predicted nucleotidyltransferase
MTPDPASPIPDIPALLARAAAILREEGASEVYVFGSLARGEGGRDSDLDFAVSGLPEERVLRAMGRLLSETGRMSDLIRVEREPDFVRYLQSTGELRRVA